MMADKTVGRPLSRVDGVLKVTGEATYAAEHNLTGLVYGVIVSSTVARGKITSVDTSRALAQPGVLRVLTDLSGAQMEYPRDEVHFFGQPVAVVVATSLEQAEHGAAVVGVEYATQPFNTDMNSPAATPTPARENPDYSRGDPDAALQAGPVLLDTTFTIPRQHHNPIEPPSSIAQWDGDRLTQYDKVQWVQGTAANLASALGVPPANVRVISPFVGGAFGSAGRTWPHQRLAALAAREMGRPVKIVVTRKQMYSGIGYRPASRQRMRLSARNDGTITGIVHEAHTETARYQQYEDGIVEIPKVLYACPNLRSQYWIYPIDANAPTYMRGPGEVSGAFAMECTMDILAHRLNIDPIDLRRRNEPRTDPESGLPYSTRKLMECYDQGARRFGWSARKPVPRSRREGNLLIGMGVATAMYHNNRRASSASARINADGTAVVASATSDIGPGTATPMTQVAADALGIRFDRITFLLGDSVLPTAPQQSGSKTMAGVGSAVFAACNSLRDRFVRMAIVDPASPLNGAKPEEIAVADGRLYVTSAPNRSETYSQILRRRRLDFMDTQQEWSPGDVDSRVSSWAHGAVFAEVSVDESLGLVRIRRLFAAYDAGRIVNPKLAHSQALSGMVAGIGMSLLEGTVVDHRDGRIVNPNLADYLVPVNADVPELDAMFLDTEDPLTTAIGVKGLGEVVIVGVPAAIANAVFNATGARVTDLPITVDRFVR